MMKMLIIESKQRGCDDTKHITSFVTKKKVPQKLRGEFYSTAIRFGIEHTSMAQNVILLNGGTSNSYILPPGW